MRCNTTELLGGIEKSATIKRWRELLRPNDEIIIEVVSCWQNRVAERRLWQWIQVLEKKTAWQIARNR